MVTGVYIGVTIVYAKIQTIYLRAHHHKTHFKL
jgi:hypothetical protein